MRIEELDVSKPLVPRTEGDLRLLFIGTGSAFSKRFNQTNLLVLKKEDHLLIDCGTKAPQALHALGLPLASIKNFLITHTHADHVGGLEEAMLMGRYVTKRKPRIVIPAAFESILWEMSLKGGSAYNEAADGRALTFGDMWEVVRPEWLPGYPRETWSCEVGAIDLKMFRTKHVPELAASWQDSLFSIGVVIDGRVLFTSDTRFDPDLVFDYTRLFRIEAIFHDCQLFPGGVHAYIDDLGTLPLKLRRKMYLTHYQENWEAHREKIRDFGFAGLAEQNKLYIFD